MNDNVGHWITERKMRRCKKCNANFNINEKICLFCGKKLVVIETGFRYIKVWGNEIFGNKVPESIKKMLRDKL